MDEWLRPPLLIVAALGVALGFTACDNAGEGSSVPLVLVSNALLADLAKEVAGPGYEVVFPLPSGESRMEWAPSAEVLAKWDGAEIFFKDGSPKPDWAAALEGKAKRVVTPPGEFAFTAALNHRSAGEWVDLISRTLADFAPADASAIATRAETMKQRIAESEAQWAESMTLLGSAQLAGFGTEVAAWAKQSSLEIEATSDLSAFRDMVKSPAASTVFVVGKHDFSQVGAALNAPDAEVLLLDFGLAGEVTDFVSTVAANAKAIEVLLKREEEAEASNEVVMGSRFEREIVPLIENYCLDCHDAETGEGELDFEVYLTEAEAIHEPDLWDSVAQVVEMGEMPPRDKSNQPSDAEREKIIAWVRDLGARWDDGEMGQDPGRTTIRRLNKNEYNYTIRDLFGMRIRPADNFPEETGGESGFDNNADALFLPSLLMENYVEAASVIVEGVYANSKSRSNYLFARPTGAGGAEGAARKTLSAWASRAYRRPVENEELDSLMRIFAGEMKAGKRYDEAMQKPLLAILISSKFLYRAEQEESSRDPYQVDDFDLATRLSYFIWSSMPDKELFGLALKGELSKPEVLEAQVMRMLQDEKARSLSMHFAGQWFGWEQLRSRANPDEDRFPQFTFDLRVALYRESAEFFHHLLQSNASIFDLIDSDYTFLNERLVKHYGISGVSGSQLQKVSLTDPNRGGVLGMGSVLTATSLPLRTSPAVRGKYVLAQLLGTPPPEPPMNVEQLPDDDQAIEAMTFREALAQHREDINCKACHEVIDPIGFGLESFDAIGRWRTTQNGLPLDTEGVMPDGTKFSSPADLKKTILSRKDLFTRNMAEKLLSYALGRDLSPYDRPAVAEITEKVLADGGKIHTAFVEVAKSYPFRYRRNDGFEPKAKTSETASN
ncbi:MAG: DUF1592 domain-containing protein [Verrucomicrobiota bacterium]